MPFVTRLRPGHIAIAPGWHGFDATVDGLLAHLVAAGALSGAVSPVAAAAIRAREREASTAILDIGVGVPHARVGGLDVPVVGLAAAAAGLYEAAPTVSIRIVALVLSPVAALEEHLRTLADIATLLHSTDLRASLLRADDAPAALAVLMQFARGLP